MRTRKWILVLAGVIALLGTGVYYSWNLFRANERIKEALLVKLRSTLDENSLIEKLEVGLGVVHLKGVNLDLPDSFYSLWIEDLRVGWSLGSWIKNGFKLSMTTDDILLIRPRLTVKYLSREQRTSPISEFSLSPWSQDKLKQFDFIKRITVSKGQIVFVDSTGQEILLASDINGWVNSVDFSNAICRMTGKLFASRQNNVFLEGQLNLSEGYLQHLEVELRDYQLSNQIPYLIPPYFDIQHGILNGNMTLSEKTAGSKGFDLAGGIRISSGRLKILNYDLVLDDLNLEAKIQDWDLVILKAHQIVNGSPVEMTGRIKNLLAPQFDLSFSSQEFDIRGFLEKLQPGFPLKLKGTSSLYLILKDSYANPSFEGWIESTRLLLNDLKLRYPRLDFVFQDSVFRVRKLQAQLGDTKVIGQGLVDFSTSNHAINFKFFCKGNGIGLLRAADLNGLKGCPWQLNLDFIGDTGQARGNGEFLCQLQPLVGDSLTIRGTLSYNQDQIQLTGHAPTHFSFSGKISNLFRQPTFNLRVKNFEELWYTCMALPGNKNLMGLNFGLQGQLQHWNFYTEALWKDQGKLISLMGEVWQQDNQKDIKGQMVFWPDKRNRLAGKFELRQTPGILYVRSFRLADLFTASGQM
ncbi:MAG: hypothetical protein ONB05_06890, partial [candidate division KSB1 bacterium]|nr:hypothetical protein [candidate division KSB1 bacterium]